MQFLSYKILSTFSARVKCVGISYCDALPVNTFDPSGKRVGKIRWELYPLLPNGFISSWESKLRIQMSSSGRNIDKKKCQVDNSIRKEPLDSALRPNTFKEQRCLVRIVDWNFFLCQCFDRSCPNIVPFYPYIFKMKLFQNF